MALRWKSSALSHGISANEIVWAMTHAHLVVPRLGRRRSRHHAPPTLVIGPSRYGTLEVVAQVVPPADVYVLHAMPLRRRTATEAHDEGDDTCAPR